MDRREFITRTALAGAGALVIPKWMIGAPEVLTPSRTLKSTAQGELVFKPYLVQKGRGPHLLDWAYASDKNWDAFHSNIASSQSEGVKISDTEGVDRFGIDVRWNVEGFGYIYITADNGGEYYSLPKSGKQESLNLNYELAKSRVVRNRKRLKKFEQEGFKASRDTQAFVDLSEDFLTDAERALPDGLKCGQFAQMALYYSMWAGEKMELEKANYEIMKRGWREGYFFGCDARAFFQMREPVFFEKYTKVFNFTNITFMQNHDGIISDIEPKEGVLDLRDRDLMIQKFREHGVTSSARMMYWFHHWVTPDWIKNKNFDQLKKYVEKHSYDIVKHYPGDELYAWEVVNELHDWANEVFLTPEQINELTKLACEATTAANPKVKKLVNNCCPYAEYVQLKEWSGQPAKYRQRTPFQFTKDLIDYGVDFDLIGQQWYFPYRDLQDIILLVEKYEPLGKTIQFSEVGVTGGPTEDSVKTGRYKWPNEPYVWHREWDEELQADWLEGVYTLAYSKPYIEAINWFDFVDPQSYMKNGGLLRSPKGEEKAAYVRLKNLQDKWNSMAKAAK